MLNINTIKRYYKAIYNIGLSLKVYGFRLILLLPCLQVNVYAQAENDEIAVRQLVTVLSKSHSMKADVDQLTLDQGGNELEELKARLVMQKPDHFRWALLEPYEQLTVTNGEKIWMYEPDLDQVTIQSFDNNLGRTPLSILTGNLESLAQSYEVSMNQLPENQGTRFLLIPTEPGSQLERLSLTFYGDVLEQMQFETTLGQKTSLYFSNTEMNVDIDPSVFEFVPPSGIEIIDTTQN